MEGKQCDGDVRAEAAEDSRMRSTTQRTDGDARPEEATEDYARMRSTTQHTDGSSSSGRHTRSTDEATLAG